MRSSTIAIRTLQLILLISLILPISARSEQTQAPCGKPPAILQSAAPNIFSEQQEQWLGDAIADHIDRDFRPIKNPALNAYLNTIGARLLAVLPPTIMQFHYTLVESSEVNGFSFAGGHVYLTRKLVASAHSEDEVAGVIAHEMGHILTHQGAIQTTADLNRLLGITSVTDRADIYTKYQRLVDVLQHQKHPSKADTDEKQDEADRVAVYAAATAGYRPQAYAEFADRTFFTGGKTGTVLGDILGATTPSQMRLRKIQGIVAALPSRCGTVNEATANPVFLQWQRDVLENQAAASGTTAGLAAGGSTVIGEVQLTPPLRLDIDHLRFSRDGKYVLAQDQSSIYVLSREPFKEIFRFDADGALPADFTPDSQQIAFTTRGLHVEQWSIAQQKLVAAHEVVSQRRCLQTLLAPDARTIVCFIEPDDRGLGLTLLDVETGKVLYEKHSWFFLDPGIAQWLLNRWREDETQDILSSALSADGNLLLIGPGADKLAFDLRTRTSIRIEGALRNLEYPSSYCFDGNDKVVEVSGYATDNSGTFSFPDGKRLTKVRLTLPTMFATTGGGLAIVPATKEIKDLSKDAVVALADINTGKYIFASKSGAIDVFAGAIVTESLNGTLSLRKSVDQDPKDVAHASLSVSPLASSRAVSLSPDGRYLAFSNRKRGTVWDLQSGKQAFLARGFRYGWWTPEGKLMAEFPAYDLNPTSIGEMTIAPAHLSPVAYKLPEKAHLGVAHLFEWKSDKGDAWTLTASSPLDGSVQWTRNFADGHPGVAVNLADNDLILSYALKGPLAKEKARNDGTLKDQANAVRDKAAGRLVEIVNSTDGSVRAQVVVEVPLTYEGVGEFTRVDDLLYLSAGDNRTIVYSLKTGAQLRQVFGSVAAADSASGIICTTNRRGEAVVLDKTGAELQRLNLNSPLRFASLRQSGAELVVLTADQRLHRFKVEPAAVASVTAAETVPAAPPPPSPK